MSASSAADKGSSEGERPCKTQRWYSSRSADSPPLTGWTTRVGSTIFAHIGGFSRGFIDLASCCRRGSLDIAAQSVTMWASALLERSSTPSGVAVTSPELPIEMNWSVAQLVLAAQERSRLFTKSARESRGNEKLLLRTESTIARTGKARTTSEIRNKRLKNPVRAVRPPLAVTMKISGSRPVYTGFRALPRSEARAVVARKRERPRQS